MQKDYEIMAPVGSRESLAAALQAGADSIYFGIEALNMRAHSANRFTIDDLKEIASTCEARGVKTYLTVNTIIYGEDLALMHEICDAAKAASISAVIAADVAVLTYCREIGQEVHLSTQLNISNIDALKFYAHYADVVVLARELNLEQVKEIHDRIVAENLCGPRANGFASKCSATGLCVWRLAANVICLWTISAAVRTGANVCKSAAAAIRSATAKPASNWTWTTSIL